MKRIMKWSMMAAVVAVGLMFFNSTPAEAHRRHAVVRHRGVYVAAPRVAVYGRPAVNVRVGGIVDVHVGGRYGVGVRVGTPYRAYVPYYRPHVYYRGW